MDWDLSCSFERPAPFVLRARGHQGSRLGLTGVVESGPPRASAKLAWAPGAVHGGRGLLARRPSSFVRRSFALIGRLRLPLQGPG